MTVRVDLVTLFPEFFTGPLSSGLMGRAREAGLLTFACHNPRDFALDKHRSVDDRPYGGGPGMVMMPTPMAALLESLGWAAAGASRPPGRLLYLSPKGRPLTQALARGLAAEPGLTLICGRYEGLDARIEDLYPVECVSVGDFVLNGGEAAAVCLIEAVARLVPGFMGHEESGEEESFSYGLLEYPHFTRPEVFAGRAVPEVLRGGDHARIAAYRREDSLRATARFRPELLDEAPLGPADLAFLAGLDLPRLGRNLYCGVVHHPVLDKAKNSTAVSLTNLDIHDIARSSCAYGLAGCFMITPLQDQRELLEEILAHWTTGSGGRSNPDRARALSRVWGAPSIQEAAHEIFLRSGRKPVLLGTSAEAKKMAGTGFAGVRELLAEGPVFLLFGTGHGLAPEAESLCSAFLPPIRGFGGYNHLSVRAAAAIVFDRIFGEGL